MAGRNLWHKPHFQPELETVNRNASSRDRYLWERKYNHHLRRMQTIQSRPVYRPKIVKRNYQQEEVRELEEEKAKKFYERTRLNMLPLGSRQTSPATSRQSSWHRPEVSTGTFSRPLSPVPSNHRPRSWPISTQTLYIRQNYPTIYRSTKVPKQLKAKSSQRSAPKFIVDSETFFQQQVAELKGNLHQASLFNIAD